MRDKAAEAGIRTMRCQSLEWMTARSSLLIFLAAISSSVRFAAAKEALQY